MNKKAQDLKLINTHFESPHGLDKDEHYTTAYELAKITDYALDIERFAQVVATRSYTVTINKSQKTILNTNELLGYLDGVNGVKTGFTNKAGRCLVTYVKRNDFEIITVVLGADTKRIRTRDSICLIEYVYSNYELINLKNIIIEKFEEWKNTNQNNIYINKGIKKFPEVKLDDNNYIFYPINIKEKNELNIQIEYKSNFEAPLSQGKVIGEVKIKIKDNILGAINIVTRKEVKRKNPIDYFYEIIGKYKQILESNI